MGIYESHLKSFAPHFYRDQTRSERADIWYTLILNFPALANEVSSNSARWHGFNQFLKIASESKVDYTILLHPKCSPDISPFQNAICDRKFGKL
jgi:hypothetical protein